MSAIRSRTDLRLTLRPPPSYQLGTPLHIALFPGSRRGELKRLLPLFHHVVILLRKRYRAMRISLVTTAALRGDVELAVSQWRYKPEIFGGVQGRDEVLKTAHIALTKTGTVTLELPATACPWSPPTASTPSPPGECVRLLITIPFVNLINIMAGTGRDPGADSGGICTVHTVYRRPCAG